MQIKLYKSINGSITGADKASVDIVSKIGVGKIFEVDTTGDSVKATRSTQQNAYYWAVVITMLAENLQSGLDKDSIHTALKAGYFGVVEVFGVLAPKRDTKSLKTSEFEQYLSWVRNWASAFRGVYIPKPRESGYEFTLPDVK